MLRYRVIISQKFLIIFGYKIIVWRNILNILRYYVIILRAFLVFLTVAETVLAHNNQLLD